MLIRKLVLAALISVASVAAMAQPGPGGPGGQGGPGGPGKGMSAEEKEKMCKENPELCA